MMSACSVDVVLGTLGSLFMGVGLGVDLDRWHVFFPQYVQTVHGLILHKA